MAGIQPVTYTVAVGNSHTVDNLHFIETPKAFTDGLPSLDTSFNVQRSSQGGCLFVTDHTQFPVLGQIMGGYAALCYLVDIWSETANRFAPGKDGATGTMSGVAQDVLGVA